MASPQLIARTSVQSPCTGVCQLDHHGCCLGCFRTLDEIARWARMTECEQAFVLAAVSQRKGPAYGIGTDCAVENVGKAKST